MLEEAGWDDMRIILNLKVRASDTVECLRKLIATTTAASDDWKSIDLVYRGKLLDQGPFITHHDEKWLTYPDNITLKACDIAEA
jgi:hypothetical protein